MCNAPRSEGNDIRIDHASVSRRHAVLHLDLPLRIEDLGGTNATFVRAPRLHAETGSTEDVRQVSRGTIEIAPGDCITLGSVLVVVRRAPASMGAPSAGGRRSSTPPDNGELIVQDEAMLALYEQAYLAAPGLISVLLLGETGTGKEALAQVIHRRSAPARARSVPRAQLRGALGVAPGKRALRPRERRLHRGAAGATGPVRGG